MLSPFDLNSLGSSLSIYFSVDISSTGVYKNGKSC
jgi:hypothetical protein